LHKLPVEIRADLLYDGRKAGERLCRRIPVLAVDCLKNRLVPPRPPALALVPLRQSELRPHGGERGEQLLLDLLSMRLADQLRLRSALKSRLNDGLTFGAPDEASARNLVGPPGELVKGEVAVEIPREKFPHPPPRLTKPNPADDIGDDNGRGDKRRHADVDRGSLIHARRPQFGLSIAICLRQTTKAPRIPAA